MHVIGLLLAFICEIIVFACFAYIGFTLDVALPIQLFVSALFFVGIIVFWGFFMSPKANKQFGVVGYYIAKSVIYGIAAIVIFYATNEVLGMLFIAAIISCELLLIKHNISRLTPQRTTPERQDQ